MNSYPAHASAAMETIGAGAQVLPLSAGLLRRQDCSVEDLPALVGQSPGIERVRALIAQLAPIDVDILINGQTGTGKEVVARRLHAVSGRKGPFVAINCGALPETVFESELFGHEAGSFTSAIKRRVGKLEYANGGTLFLDEIETMPLELQVKLLRVLQERRLERLGSNEQIAIDCRVVVASKADLVELSASGRFRADLYYRIGVVSIDLPALTERREDIPLLLEHFIDAACTRFRLPPPRWSAAEMRSWQDRPWPGNVRELRNFADRLVLGVAGTPTAIQSEQSAEPQGLPDRMDRYERDLILEALRDSGGHVSAAAAALGIPRKTLYDKLRKHQIGCRGAAA